MTGNPAKQPSPVLPNNASEQPNFATEPKHHDDDYRKFVEGIWSEAGVTFPPICAEVDGLPCKIVSVSPRKDGSTYVNALVNDEKRTFVAANHNWARDQQEINDSAFLGVLSGAPADETLRYEPEPKSIAEARIKDRAKPVGKRYLVNCQANDESGSWRVISGVSLGSEYIDATSHFDWGDRVRLGFTDISAIMDAETGEQIPFEDFKREIELAPPIPETSVRFWAKIGLINGILFVIVSLTTAAIFYWLLGENSQMSTTAIDVKDQVPTPSSSVVAPTNSVDSMIVGPPHKNAAIPAKPKLQSTSPAEDKPSAKRRETRNKKVDARREVNH